MPEIKNFPIASLIWNAGEKVTSSYIMENLYKTWRKESKSFLQKAHDNSLTSLVASLYDGKNISKEDLDELKKFIEEAE